MQTIAGLGIISAAAAMASDYGMIAKIDDNNSIYVTDYQPSEETHYRAIFLFDPNSITMADGDAHYLLSLIDFWWNEIAHVEFQRSSGNYQVRANVLNDEYDTSYTSWVTISDESHLLELQWLAATGDGANDGKLLFWIDENLEGSITEIDNDRHAIDSVILGPVYEIDPGTEGTEYFDLFISRRDIQSSFALQQEELEFAQADTVEQSESVAQAQGKAGLARLAPKIMQPEVRMDTSLITVSYAYDSLYRLTAANYSDGNFFHYTYDAVGNKLTETTKFGTNTYVYDAANRLVSVNAVNYTWDNNGNLLSDGEYTYTYDHANRLKTVTDGVNTSSYAYNGLGDRVSETVNEVTTDYVLDLAGGLTQVLAEGTNSYLYGNARIMQEDSSAEKEYFLGDALGSVRMLAEEFGEITLLRNYEPYGEVLSSQGSGETRYAFTGEQYDPQTGLVYLRARYYSTASGRFMSRDAWRGDEGMPMSYYAWLYGYGNPTMYTDPTGMWSCSGHPDCKSWVANALNILSTMSETGRELVNFFYQRDEDRKKQLSSSYMGHPDCTIPDDLPYGVRIVFGDPFPGPSWGTAIYANVLQLSNGPEVINGPIPDGFGLQLIGHEISHWAQGAVRFTIQGELLARFVEQQLREDLLSKYGEIKRGAGETKHLVTKYNPFFVPHLQEARDWMMDNFGFGYFLFPLPSVGGLDKNWLENFRVKVELPNIPPQLRPAPTPPVGTPIP